MQEEGGKVINLYTLPFFVADLEVKWGLWAERTKKNMAPNCHTKIFCLIGGDLSVPWVN